MHKRNFRCYSVILLLVVTLFAVGCAKMAAVYVHVNYVGESLAPTTTVDVYSAKDDIKQEYTIMGQALGSGTALISDIDDVEKKLIEEAKRKGADAVLLTKPDGASQNRMIASFLKYK